MSTWAFQKVSFIYYAFTYIFIYSSISTIIVTSNHLAKRIVSFICSLYQGENPGSELSVSQIQIQTIGFNQRGVHELKLHYFFNKGVLHLLF